MNRIRFYFASKKVQMAQLHDLKRQLQEAWAENALLTFANETLIANAGNMVDQLHRVVRERDNERKMRMEAEKLRDVYLEQLKNEEE